MSNHTGGPTLNITYNNLLKDWAAAGSPNNPECEDCGKDTTDKQMHDLGNLWVCRDCYLEATSDNIDEHYLSDHPVSDHSDREDFHSDG
jgi:hypothetical protein